MASLALENRLDVMQEIAHDVGRFQLENFRKQIHITEKAPGEFVTNVDLEADQIIRSTIHQHFPKDAYCSEECDLIPGTSPYTWLTDPLDGTHMYMNGIPLWCTCITLIHEGNLVASCVYSEIVNDCFTAMLGHGAWLNGEPIRCSSKRTLAKAFLLSHCGFKSRYHRFFPVFKRLIKKTERARSLGYTPGICYVAAGFADLYVEAESQFYDVAPAVLLIEEAGGIVRNWKGQEIDRSPQARNDIILGPKEIVEQTLAVIAQVT